MHEGKKFLELYLENLKSIMMGLFTFKVELQFGEGSPNYSWAWMYVSNKRSLEGHLEVKEMAAEEQIAPGRRVGCRWVR